MATEPTHPSTHAAPAVLDRSTVLRLTLLYAASRIVVVFVALTSTWISSGGQTVYGALTRWDSGWYGFIAQSGYPEFTTAEGPGNRWGFFPGWPLLLRIAHAVVGGTWQRNGIVLAAVIGLLLTLVLYVLVADRFGPTVAWRTCSLFLFAPGAATLSMVYSEGLFILCVVGCLYALGRRWWIVAGLAAALGSGVRLAGLTLVACCAVAAVAELRRTRSRRPLLAPLLAPGGFVLFVLYQRLRSGSFTAYFDVQERYWDNGNSLGLGLLRAVRDVATKGSAWENPAILIPVVMLVVAIVGLVLIAGGPSLPGEWWVATVGLLLVAVTPEVVYPMPRFFLPVLAIPLGFASRLPDRWSSTVLAASAVLMSVVAMLYFNTVGFQMAP